MVLRSALLAGAESRRLAACLALSLGAHAGGFLAAAHWQAPPATTGAVLTVSLRNGGTSAQIAAPPAEPAPAETARPQEEDENLARQASRRSAAAGGKAAETPPEPLAQITPAFPEGAYILGIVSGRVELEASIDESGRVDSVRIVASSAGDVFNASALAAIRATRFKPATVAGVPVRSTIRPVIVYDLGDKTAER